MGTRGVGARRAGPRAPGGRSGGWGGRREPVPVPNTHTHTHTPSATRSEARPGAPARQGWANATGTGPRPRPGPSGLLTSAMSCSSRPPAPRRTRSLLRLRWARSHRAGPREARSGPDGGQSQPAARRPPSRPGDPGHCAAAPRPGSLLLRPRPSAAAPA
jgi:hypothetical protein